MMANTEALNEVCSMLDTYGGRDKVSKAKSSSQIFIFLLIYKDIELSRIRTQ